MTTIKRKRLIAASPDAIFAVIADPDMLPQLLPRVSRVEFLERGDDYARIATYMDLRPIYELRSEGEVRWRQNQELVFTSKWPTPVEAHWILRPIKEATELTAMLTIDIRPLLGPLALLVPAEQVTGLIGPKIDAALERIARRVEHS